MATQTDTAFCGGASKSLGSPLDNRPWRLPECLRRVTPRAIGSWSGVSAVKVAVALVAGNVQKIPCKLMAWRAMSFLCIARWFKCFLLVVRINCGFCLWNFHVFWFHLHCSWWTPKQSTYGCCQHLNSNRAQGDYTVIFSLLPSSSWGLRQMPVLFLTPSYLLALTPHFAW